MHPDPAQLLSQLREARESLSQLGFALETPGPDLWQQATPRLEHAAGLLASVERKLTAGESIPLDLRAEIRAGLRLLAADVRRIDALMRAAADFYAGWAQLVGAATGGYTRSGKVIPASTAAHVSLRG